MHIQNFNYNTQNSKPAFNGVKLYSGADDVLKRVFTKHAQWDEFKQVIDDRAMDSCTDLIFYGRGEKKLTAKICPKNINQHTQDIANKLYKQHFWQSTINFIKKMSEKTQEVENDICWMPDNSKIDSILSLTK